ncbi:MAG: glycosyltransferase, partial [Candidatus Bathycorpusculaceae bacterium]
FYSLKFEEQKIIKYAYLVCVMKLLFDVGELGLGHVARAILLGKKLKKKGHELFFFSGGRAYELLKKEFDNVNLCTPVGWYENAYGVITSASLLNILIPLPRYNREKNKFEIKSSSAEETVHRYYDLRQHIRKIKPDLIISDGDIHALRLAHRWRIPAVYITNIIRPSYDFSPFLIPGERFTERYVRKCTKIIVPDNPPPYTLCEYNLGDLNHMRITSRVEFVGSFLNLRPEKGSEEHVFAPISGPYGTRAKLMQTIIPVLTTLEIKSVVSLGEPGEKATKKLRNCEIHTWLSHEERDEYMKNAKLIVFSGGHTTCFETIKYIKPSICIPTQAEQMANAKKMQQLKCSIIVKNKEQLKLAIQEIENEKNLYKAKLEMLNKSSSRFNGLDQAVNIIEDLSVR